jgi:hypothetical protein
LRSTPPGPALNSTSAASAINEDIDTIASLNPALTPPVVEGRLLIPAGYRLRLPVDKAAAFDSWMVAYEEEARERDARERQQALARAEAAREAALARKEAAREAAAERRAAAAARGSTRRVASGRRTPVAKVPVTNSVGRATRVQRPKSGRGSRT